LFKAFDLSEFPNHGYFYQLWYEALVPPLLVYHYKH